MFRIDIDKFFKTRIWEKTRISTEFPNGVNIHDVIFLFFYKKIRIQMTRNYVGFQC